MDTSGVHVWPVLPHLLLHIVSCQFVACTLAARLWPHRHPNSMFTLCCCCCFVCSTFQFSYNYNHLTQAFFLNKEKERIAAAFNNALKPNQPIKKQPDKFCVLWLTVTTFLPYNNAKKNKSISKHRDTQRTPFFDHISHINHADKIINFHNTMNEQSANGKAVEHFMCDVRVGKKKQLPMMLSKSLEQVNIIWSFAYFFVGNLL